jgi:uncharacterized protein
MSRAVLSTVRQLRNHWEGSSMNDVPQASSTPEERSGALVTYILTAIFCVFGALIGWAIYKDKGSFAKDQTTEALNFGITWILAGIVADILGRIMMFLGVLSFLVWIVAVVFSIMGAVAANKGQIYRYPFNLRLIK